MQKQKYISMKNSGFFFYYYYYPLHINNFNEDEIREIKKKFTEIHRISRENIRALYSIISLASYTTNTHDINAYSHYIRPIYIPIGQLSEKVAEAHNKHFRFFR